MKINIKLMGMLKEKTPESGLLKLPEGSTIAAALAELGVPEGTVKVFTLNGDLIRDPSHLLKDGDELTVLPPVGGG